MSVESNEGGATETTLALIKAKTDNLDVLLSTRASEATLLTRLLDSKFPATGLLADASANPTLTAIQNYLMGFNGATWDRIRLDGALGNLQTRMNSWLGSALPTVAQKVMASSIPVVIASDQSKVETSQEEALICVTATGAVNTAVTCTLPAVASNFHYIVAIQLQKLYSVVGIANGAGVIITTTNFATNNPSFTTEQLASPAGTVATVINIIPARPIKSTTVNVATTFVAPLQLQTIWRWNVFYYVAP